MKIGIDIDDTISASFEELFIHSQNFDIDVVGREGNPNNYGKIDNHNYIETMYPHWSQEQIKTFWEKYFMEVLTKANAKKECAQVIEKLKKEENQIILITSRYEIVEGKKLVENATKQWLEEHHILYDKLIMNSQDKSKVAVEEKIDLLIDDSIAHCLSVEKKNIKTFLYTTVCNQGCEVPNLERVYSWPQIYKKYQDLKIE